MLYFTRLNAGVLSMVLGICLIITLITSSMILLGYYYRVRHLNIKIKTELSNRIASGQAWVLSNPYAYEYNNPTIIDLFEEGTDSVKITRYFWGLWDIYHLSAQKSVFVDQSRLMIGFRPDSIGSAALYLADDRRPISIAGDTKIKGDVYLPPAGIKSTYINRKGYMNDSLVYGKIKDSNPDLPPLNQGRLSQLSLWLKGHFGGSIKEQNSFYIKDSISQKVSFTYAITKSKQAISITDDTLNYEIVYSDTLISLGSRSIVEGAILIAPKIIIQEGFKGSLQAFASDSLVVEDEVELLYPSALVVMSDSDTCYLSVGKSIVAGQIILYGPKAEIRNKMLALKKGSLVNGFVYCDGIFNFEGKVIGHVSTRKFYLRVNSSIFENHLFDVQIRQELSSSFLQSDLWGASKKAGVLKFIKHQP